MIRKIGVEALKSIKNIQVECSKLNLLVGTNSSGKSSFLQSILLVAQNTMEEEGLNGSLVSLGEFREVRKMLYGNRSSYGLVKCLDKLHWAA